MRSRGVHLLEDEVAGALGLKAEMKIQRPHGPIGALQEVGLMGLATQECLGHVEQWMSLSTSSSRRENNESPLEVVNHQSKITKGLVR